MFRIAVVAIAVIITPPSIKQARGVSAPMTRSAPQTNSTNETKNVLNSGKGMCAFSIVWRIISRRSGIDSLPRPERTNSRPTANRAIRIPNPCHACNSLTNDRTQNMPEASPDIASRLRHAISGLTAGQQLRRERGKSGHCLRRRPLGIIRRSSSSNTNCTSKASTAAGIAPCKIVL